MVPYIVAFMISICLTFIGQKVIQRKKLVGGLIFLFVILGLSLFAALRDYSVGADLLAHKRIYYDTAVSSDSLGSYLSLFNNEYLFQVFVYGFANVFGSYRLLMFVFTFIPLSVLFYYGYKNNQKHLALLLFVYLLMFFNTSLNVIRQVMAISFLIPAFFSLQDGKKMFSLLLIIVASFFHISAVAMLIVFAVDYFAKQKKQMKYYAIFILAFAIMCSMLSVLAKSDLISSMGYGGYLRQEKTNLNGYFLALKICIFVFITYFYKLYNKDEKCKKYYYFAILDMLFYFFSFFVMYGYRFSYYFVVFYPFFISSIAEKTSKKERTLFYTGIIVALLIYWLARNVLIGYDATIPYLIGAF